MATSDAVIQLRALVGDASIVMFTSRAPSGELHSRPLTLGEIDDDGNLVFLVDAAADWVAGLRPEDETNASITNDDDRVWLSISGRATVTEDRAMIHRLWTPHATTFFPEGPDSVGIRVLSMQSRAAEYWDAPSSRLHRLAVGASSLLGNPAAKQGESGTIELT